MKRCAFAVLTLFVNSIGFALPVANPSEPSLLTEGFLFNNDICCCNDPSICFSDAFSFRLGFYGDYVYNRHMKIGHSDDDIESSKNNIRHFEIFTNAGYLALNISHRFDLFGTLGTSTLNWQTNANNLGLVAATNQTLSVQSETNFSWSIGARATLLEWECSTIGLEGQYFSFKPNTKRITYADSESLYPDETSDHHSYSEWQLGVGLSHRIAMFVPYVAIRYGKAHYDQDNEPLNLPLAGNFILPDFKDRNDFGYALGTSLVDCDRALVTVEGRFIGEKALYVNGQFRF